MYRSGSLGRESDGLCFQLTHSTIYVSESEPSCATMFWHQDLCESTVLYFTINHFLCGLLVPEVDICRQYNDWVVLIRCIQYECDCTLVAVGMIEINE